MRSSPFRCGFYHPTNPSKYVGDVTKIVYRSSWEQYFCKFLDHNPNVIGWSSEEIAIPYIKPTDAKVHQYFVDFYCKYRTRTGEVIEEIIEVKPKYQTTVPLPGKKAHKTKVYEAITYAINQAKWQAAAQYAAHHGWKFRIVTEDQLFG